MFRKFSNTAYLENKTKSNSDENMTKFIAFDLKTGINELDEVVNGMGDDFWTKIMSVVNVNRAYHQCVSQIMDTQNVQSVEDIIRNVSLALQNENETERFESELIASCKENSVKLKIVLDCSLKIMRDRENKLNSLKKQLVQKADETRIAENQVAILTKEKKDLLNISKSYVTENVHKLEKKIEEEQRKNKELREMIASIFKKKVS